MCSYKSAASVLLLLASFTNASAQSAKKFSDCNTLSRILNDTAIFQYLPIERGIENKSKYFAGCKTTRINNKPCKVYPDGYDDAHPDLPHPPMELDITVPTPYTGHFLLTITPNHEMILIYNVAEQNKNYIITLKEKIIVD